MPIATHAPQLLANTTLSRLMHDKLTRLSPMDNAALIDNVWRFQLSKRVITADFTLFEKPFLQFAQAVTVRFDEQNIPLNLIDFVKLIWLEVASEIKGRLASYHQIIDKLALLFHYLHARQLDQLDVLGLEEFYEMCLTQNATKEGIKKRLYAPAHPNRFEPLSLNKLKLILNRYGVTNVVGEISYKRAASAMNEACSATIRMTG